MEEFWGVEVKNGGCLKVSPGDGLVLHLSQASLGELKDKKGKETVNLFVNVDGKKLVLGTLITNKLPQHQFDLLFDRDFELSHNWKSGSVFFYGYKASKSFEDESFEGESDESESKEDIPFNVENNVKSESKVKQEKLADTEKANASIKKESDPGRDPVIIAEIRKDLNTQEVDESTYEDLMSDDDDKDDSQVETSKKRPLESVEFATVTPIQEKRAKVTPEGIGNPLVLPSQSDDNKTAPLIVNEVHPNQPNKQPHTLKKYPCKICNKLFTTEVGVEAHTKAKHGDVQRS